jgi:hypothetical protein
MRLFGRGGGGAGARFAELIDRQLDLFLADNRGLLERIDAAVRLYDASGRDAIDPKEATQLWGDVVDLVEEGTEALADIRDHYAWNQLDADAQDEYIAAFNRAVAKRLPRFALEIENR